MRWLIRRVLKKNKGSLSYEEDSHYGEVLSIGRAADQAIFLPDLHAALNHARVTLLPGNQYKVESLILSGIRVNGDIVYNSIVAANSTIEIGNTQLLLLEAPQDFDAAVEVSTLDKRAQKSEKEKRAKPTTLSQAHLSKRGPAWVGFSTVFIFGLLLPILGHFVPGFGELLKHTPLPSSTIWSPGTLDAAHHFFASDCTRCHQSAFVRVQDAACLTCHASTPAHTDSVKFNLSALGNANCRTCHQDHQGLRGLVRTDQRLCADCHNELNIRTKNASQLANVADFGTTHPQFKINLPAWDANGLFAPQRGVWTHDLKENSGLKFNHLKHLSTKGLNAPDGHRVLDCNSCHQLDAGGDKMQPVAFETMCHGCHKLGFDTLAPDREVPHGKITEIGYMLTEFYARRALEGGYADAQSPAIVQERRRPGAPPLSRQEQQEALAWARDKTRSVAESLFTGRACATCHKVLPPKNANDLWQVAPVRVSSAWYAKAKFTHTKHTTLTCNACHEARQSESSSDVLIPEIGNCRTCHAGAYAKDRVATTCIACHDFHRAKQ